MTNQNEGIQIHGTVADGFEPVRSLFEHNMNTLAERNTQLCIYYDGERVVDLWASADGNSQFSAELTDQRIQQRQKPRSNCDGLASE